MFHKKMSKLLTLKPLIMRFVLALFLACCFSVQSQVPTSQSTGGSSSFNGPYWTKTGSYDYTLYDKDGKALSNVMDLKYLDTDTLGVLDKSRRDIYLLADFKNASDGDSGSAMILARNVGNSFYFTNKYSFSHFVDDVYDVGAFSNINGTYIYYLARNESTYELKDIRSYPNWGARSSTKLPYSANNTYWYRDVERGEYGVIKNGKTIDYSVVTAEKEGNDMVVKENGVKTYLLTDYYTASSFNFQPIDMYSTPVSSTGCVRGNCTDGWGKYEYDNGHYDGFWKNGQKNGYGLYKWPGTGKYIGNWVNDQMSGYGVYIADNNDNIIGNYEYGELNGLGLTVSGDDWEQGVFANGSLITSYDFFSNDETSGCTAGDCQNKYGRFKWSNGDSFTGFFNNGNMLMGTYTFASGDKYSGMFNSNNQFHGTGRFFFKSGAYYGGEWNNGKYSGLGYYHDQDLVQQIGEWSNGNLVRSMK